MNISELERRLREKEKELWEDMTRAEAEARELGGGEVQNRFDSSESKESVFQATTAEWSVFAQVREALQRIERGTYGTCVDCGRQIEDHRLDSVPWTAYCLDHQKQHERDLEARPR